jgi:enoyl-CoA hydratase
MSVELSRREECAVLVLNRPDALNALSFAIVREIGAALDEVGTWPVRAIIVTGAGRKAFCAGADIKELRGRGLVDQKRGAELGQAVFAKLERLPFASVAVINGYAFGGGLELALACTFRPEEIARLVGVLFREQIGFLTGETIYVDGGQGVNH